MNEVISVLGRNLGSALIGFALGRSAGARTLQMFAGESLDRFMALADGPGPIAVQVTHSPPGGAAGLERH
jgi:hypothetical protein